VAEKAMPREPKECRGKAGFRYRRTVYEQMLFIF
jgi:hypothetical protein